MNVNVLIVDDSAILRKVVGKAVRQAGIDDSCIREAGNGREALTAIEESEPDVVLLDINMPVMNGEELMEVLDATGRAERMAVVIVSTEVNAKRLMRLAGLGAKARLKKPFEPEELRDLLTNLIGERAQS